MPALAKQPSTRPRASSVLAIAAFTDIGSETSQIRVSTLPGRPAIEAAAALFFSALRPQIETLHPAAAKACAMPRPMPPLPPVMTALRPERSKMFMAVFPFWGIFKEVGWVERSEPIMMHQRHLMGIASLDPSYEKSLLPQPFRRALFR